MTKHNHQYIMFLLFTLLIVYVNSEFEDGLKKRGDTTKKSQASEESDDEKV